MAHMLVSDRATVQYAIDHIFTLLALTQNQLLTPGSFYAAFIDFKVAFDFVDR